jgi:hypothetical protein
MAVVLRKSLSNSFAEKAADHPSIAFPVAVAGLFKCDFSACWLANAEV